MATSDCTGGTYATREWSGLAVGPLLDAATLHPDAATVRFISTTGHRWPLPLAEARRARLATHVGGTPLSHTRSFPLRLSDHRRIGGDARDTSLSSVPASVSSVGDATPIPLTKKQVER